MTADEAVRVVARAWEAGAFEPHDRRWYAAPRGSQKELNAIGALLQAVDDLLGRPVTGDEMVRSAYVVRAFVGGADDGNVWRSTAMLREAGEKRDFDDRAAKRRGTAF